MSLLEELHPASFKGVPWLVFSSSINGGRKDVKHSFLNSNRQSIEDLGLAPRVFTLNGVITGAAYIQDRDRFIAKLEEGGPGILVHPFYGPLNNYVARTFTLSEETATLGEAKFSIVFELSDTGGVPTKTQSTLSTIETARDAYIVKTVEDITANYEVTPGFTGNFTEATNKLSAVEEVFAASSSVRQAAADEINAFNSELTSFAADVNTLVQTPEVLAASVAGLFSSLNALYLSPDNALAALAGFTAFGDDDTPVALDTAGRIERDKNATLINSQIQSVALSYSYFNTAQLEFSTVEEIDESAGALEEQYDKQINADGFTDDTKSALTDLRTAMQVFFDEQRITAQRELTVFTPLTTARLLAFQYYADSSRGSALITLNEFQEVSFVAGNVKVLSA